jgi:hypothetical protein
MILNNINWADPTKMGELALLLGIVVLGILIFGTLRASMELSEHRIEKTEDEQGKNKDHKSNELPNSNEKGESPNTGTPQSK